MEVRFPRALPLRAWPLDASWHARRQQGIGVLFALLPLLRRAPDLPAALERHAAPFGCNMWTAPLLLGAMARLEAEGRGEEAARLRDRLAPPLSAVGDVHVWKAVRPAALALALVGTLLGHPIAAIGIAMALYGAALFRAWGGGFRRGWERGAALEQEFLALRPDPRLESTLQAGLGILAGVLAGWGVADAWWTAPSAAFLMSGALLVGYHAAQRSSAPGVAFLGWVLLASLLGRFSNPVGLR